MKAILYSNCHTVLSSVFAIYLIKDRTDGKQYILSKNITEEEVIQLENVYKRKLPTREYGMNE